jgi:pantetheine-phosphate adenylyltransferase
MYAGSFDPPTNGHLWMIREAAPLFDELIVAIGINPAKLYAYSLERRLQILRDCAADLPNVRVSSFSIRLLADYARGEGARYLLRGIRSESDYEYERGMRYVNEDLNPDLTTVFLIPPRAMVEVSSSMVKGLIGSAGWERAVRNYVPQPAYRAILEDALARRFSQL